METVRTFFTLREFRRYAVFGFIVMVPLVTLGVWLSIEYQKGNRVIAQGVFVKDINLGGYTPVQAERLLELKFHETFERPITLIDGDFHPSFSPEAVGLRNDSSGLVKEAFVWGHRGSVFKRCWERFIIRCFSKKLQPRLYISQGRYRGFLRLLEKQVNQESKPSEIYLFSNGKAIATPSGNGRRLNVNALQKKIEKAIWTGGQQVNLPIEVITPELTYQQVEKWSLTNIMGKFSTRFNPHNVDRSHNVAIASASLQNTLVLPGHKFSFNAIVGARVSEQGYREAPVIIKNKLTPGIGGGVCQVSTTLYNAILLAGFSKIGRRNHSLASTYVPLGQDATVVDGAVDLTFVNTNATPVLLATDFNPSGIITVAVLGIKEHPEEIHLEAIVKKKFPFSSVEMNDPTLTVGERKVEEEGKDGFTVELWRIRRGEDGKILREKVNQSYYPPVPELIKLGPVPTVTPEEALPGTS